jgi:hypothetical protein
MEVLAAIGGGGTVIGLVAVITLAFKYAGAIRGQLEILANYAKLDEEYDALEVDRNGLKVELDGARESLRRERDLRAAVEAERNEAYRKARDYYAARIKASSVADAVRLVDELLSMPIPGGVSEDLPAGDPARTDDDLLKPAGM